MQGWWLLYIFCECMYYVYILFSCKSHSQTCDDNFHDSVPYDFFDNENEESVESHRAADLSPQFFMASGRNLLTSWE